MDVGYFAVFYIRLSLILPVLNMRLRTLYPASGLCHVNCSEKWNKARRKAQVICGIEL